MIKKLHFNIDIYKYKQNGVYNGCNSAVSPSFDELEIHLKEIFSE